jgi:hypothetical protein
MEFRADFPTKLPINIDPISVNNTTPTDWDIWMVAGELTNRCTGGTSRMHAEDVKAWLHGIKLKKNPKVGPANGEHWRVFVGLVQAIWDHGDIPPQLLWVIVVLIPKGRGDYHGIGLLEPMWKCANMLWTSI